MGWMKATFLSSHIKYSKVYMKKDEQVNLPNINVISHMRMQRQPKMLVSMKDHQSKCL